LILAMTPTVFLLRHYQLSVKILVFFATIESNKINLGEVDSQWKGRK
jgi:hypothetical protein